MSKESRKHQFGLCFYCGQPAELTVDHVVPECLFGGKAPKDVPRVPACATCNNVEKSGDDTYLRDFLVADLHNSLSPRARQLFDGPFLRSVGRNQSKFAHDAAKARPVEVVTPSGIIMGTALSVSIPDNRISYILARMVRGLYHCYIGRHIGVELPLRSRFAVCRKFDRQAIENDLAGIREFARLGEMVGGVVSVADGSVFRCVYAYDPRRPEVSQWFLDFFDNPAGGTFYVGTNIGRWLATVVA